MARKLKVFAADLGFVRAVVAAPSRKAALEAWGVHDDLFARGTAQEIDDAALVREATASPGVVVRRPIAAASDLLGAAKSSSTPRPIAAPRPRPGKTKRRRPPPSRKALEAAESELRDEEKKHDLALKTLEAEQADLDSRLARAKSERAKAVKRARAKRDKAKTAFGRALRTWDGG